METKAKSVKGLPKKVLDLFPKWSYQCPQCGNQYDDVIQSCVKCGTLYDKSKWRIPPKFLKNYDTLSEYAHKILAPKLAPTQRDLLFQYFTEFFSDDFETNNLNNWDDAWTAGGATIDTSGTQHHHGNYCAIVENVKEAYDEAFVYKRFASAETGDVYARVYCRLEDVPTALGIFRIGIMMRGESPSYPSIGYTMFYIDGTGIKWGVRSTLSGSWTTYLADDYTTINPDYWYCIELMQGVTSGNIKLWIEDSLVVDQNVTSAVSGIQQVEITAGRFDNSEPSARTIYYDCFVAADTKIGLEDEEEPPAGVEADFESGDLEEEFDDTTTSDGNIIPTTDVAHHGTYSCKCDVNADGNAYAEGYFDIAEQQPVYCRGYFRFNQLPETNKDYTIICFENTSGQTTVGYIQLINDNGTTKWKMRRDTGNPTYSTSTTNIPEVDTWVCIECAHGENLAKLWVNGDELLTHTDASNQTIDSVHVGACSTDMDADDTLEIHADCIIVTDEYIGVETDLEVTNLTVINISSRLGDLHLGSSEADKTVVDGLLHFVGDNNTNKLMVEDEDNKLVFGVDTVDKVTEIVDTLRFKESVGGDHFNIQVQRLQDMADHSEYNLAFNLPEYLWCHKDIFSQGFVGTTSRIYIEFGATYTPAVSSDIGKLVKDGPNDEDICGTLAGYWNSAENHLNVPKYVLESITTPTWWITSFKPISSGSNMTICEGTGEGTTNADWQTQPGGGAIKIGFGLTSVSTPPKLSLTASEFPIPTDDSFPSPDPSYGELGRLFIRSDEGKLYQWSGTGWTDLGGIYSEDQNTLFLTKVNGVDFANLRLNDLIGDTLYSSYGFIGDLTVPQALLLDTIYGLTNVDMTIAPYSGRKIKLDGDVEITGTLVGGGGGGGSHTHDSSDIVSGTLSTARIPVLSYSKVSFCNQNLNMNNDAIFNSVTGTSTTAALKAGSGEDMVAIVHDGSHGYVTALSGSLIIGSSTGSVSFNTSTTVYPYGPNQGNIGTDTYYWGSGWFNYLRYKDLDSFDALDDLTLVKNYKIKTIERNGIETEVIDHTSLPFLIAEKTDPNAETFFDAGRVNGFLLGCTKRLVKEIETLQTRISAIENKNGAD